MKLNKKQEEKLADLLANIGTVVFTAIVAGQFFSQAYSSEVKKFVINGGGLAIAIVCWIGSIYLAGD